MDNFRKYKTGRSGGSLDGFAGPRQSNPRLGPAARPVRPLGAPVGQKPTLDTFRKTEGFQAANKPIGLKPAAPGIRRPLKEDSPIKLDLPSGGASKTTRGKKTKQLTRRRKILRVAGVFSVAIVLVVGFIVGKAFITANNILKGGGSAAALDKNVDPSKLNGEGDGRVNILLLGKGGEGHEAPDLTDTLLVASIDPIQKEAALLSIPRDLWVKSENGNSKINAVYANAKYNTLSGPRSNGLQQKAEKAGLEAVEGVIEENMGIPIHYHVMVDFVAFKQAVDAVGGIEIDVDEKNTVYEVLYDPTTRRKYTLDVKAGKQKFDGTRALFYSRSRQTSARGDFDRGQRQRLVIVGLKERVLSVGTFSNPNKISQLLDVLGDRVQTNLTLGEMLRLYEISKEIPDDKIASLSFVDPPNVLVQTANISGQSVVVPISGTNDFTKIQSFVRNALKDAFLKKENANVAIFNGTNVPGLAAKKAEELRSFGYTVTTVGNAAEKTYTKNVLVDMTKGQKKFTQNYLEKRLGSTAIATVPDASLNTAGADFVIIIGANDSSAQ